MRVDPVECRNV